MSWYLYTSKSLPKCDSYPPSSNQVENYIKAYSLLLDRPAPTIYTCVIVLVQTSRFRWLSRYLIAWSSHILCRTKKRQWHVITHSLCSSLFFSLITNKTQFLSKRPGIRIKKGLIQFKNDIHDLVGSLPNWNTCYRDQ